MLAVLADFLLLLVFVAAEAERESHLIGGCSDHILGEWAMEGIAAKVQRLQIVICDFAVPPAGWLLARSNLAVSSFWQPAGPKARRSNCLRCQ